jgi:DNA gyrase subunit B
MDEDKRKLYLDDAITHLDDIEHIRLRISMYLGTIGPIGLYKLDCEPIQNALDEAMEGFGDIIKVTLDSEKNLMVVEDWGRGIPITKMKAVFTESHTGGKFNNNTYKFHAGANGTGNAVVAALTDWLQVEVYREGFELDGEVVPAKHGRIVLERGIVKDEFYEDLPNGIPKGKHRGTTVSYITDETVLKTREHDVKKLCDQFNNLSYSNNGIRFIFDHDGKVEEFYHTGGVKEQISDFINAKKLKPVIPTVDFYCDEAHFDFNVIFTYGTSNGGDSNIVSYVNGNTTPLHGFHVGSLRAGASLALTDYVKENPDIVPKSMQKLNISGTLISDNIIAVIGVRHEDPLFDGQTKDSFKSLDVQEPIKQTTRRVFGKWLRDNPQQAKKLVSMMIDYAKYEEERKKLKKNLIESKAAKSAFAANGVDPTKYTTCRSNNPEEKELFIVEGDSAGGNVVLAQDREFQALYCLTGKILNVIKANKNNLSKVILELVQILGMGLPTGGNVPNYKNLQYHKIIILTDADDDGAHIATLLLAFFYTFYPKLIEDGRIFIANPPIKKLTMSNGKYFYIHTEADFDRLMSNFIVESFDIISAKNGYKLSKGFFKEFIHNLNGYDILMDNHANSLAIDPNLLEYIVVNIQILTQCTDDVNGRFNREFYKRTGFFVHKMVGQPYYTFDRGTYHANLRLDQNFISRHFDEISYKLNQIMFYGVALKGKRSGKVYRGTIYNLMKIMYGILGPKIDIKRFKGLGEMKYEDLSETTINPTTRLLTQVSMPDAEKADKAMQIFMNDTFIKYKRLFYAGRVDFD